MAASLFPTEYLAWHLLQFVGKQFSIYGQIVVLVVFGLQSLSSESAAAVGGGATKEQRSDVNETKKHDEHHSCCTTADDDTLATRKRLTAARRLRNRNAKHAVAATVQDQKKH